MHDRLLPARTPAIFPHRIGARIARGILDRMLPALRGGCVRVVLPSGESLTLRGPQDGPQADVTILRWRTLWRLMAESDIGLARSYIDGDWSTSDLAAVLQFGLFNEAALAAAADGWLLPRTADRFRHRLRLNTRRGSRRNIAAHYDLGNAFYGAWLDAGLNYSSALYDGGERTLEEAQDAKLALAARHLDLAGGERVLEIGCGWGAMAEHLVRRGCAVTGLTLSPAQLAYAQQRLRGLGGGADLRLQDYRDVAEKFDRIVSIEMIEGVGERYWPAYFRTLSANLAEQGVAVLQAITIAEGRFAAYRARPDFIQRFIFPGGMLPTVAIICSEAARAGLTLVAHEPFGQSYALTLQEWRARFLRAWPQIAPLGFDQRFRRMWEYYLAFCEAGFREGTTDVAQFKFVKA